MRVGGGKLRSRPLAGPKSNAVRPTSDRLREALFNILTHSYGDPVTGARVLDLFAGTGALGVEAISRGAAYTLFVDEGVEARALRPGSVKRIPLSHFHSCSSIRLTARVLRKRQSALRTMAAGSNPKRCWWWKRLLQSSRRRKDSRNWSGVH